MAQFILNGGFGMPAGMQQLLQEKYRQSGQLTAAQSNQANAQAKLDAQRAAVVQPLAQSQIGLEKTQGGLNNANAYKAKEEGDMVKPLGFADINYKNSAANAANANARLDNMRSDYFPRITESTLDLNRSQIGLQGKLGGLYSSQSGLYDTQSRNEGLGLLFNKRGTARVPGKGEGDTVPSMLEPNEAVLNKHAADMLGRKKIAELNKKGNAKREKENVSKVAAMLKSMSSGMV